MFLFVETARITKAIRRGGYPPSRFCPGQRRPVTAHVMKSVRGLAPSKTLAARRPQPILALRRLVPSLDGVRDQRRAFDLTGVRRVLGGKSVPVKPHPVGAWHAAAARPALVCLVLLLCLGLASGPTSIAAHVIEVAR